MCWHNSELMAPRFFIFCTCIEIQLILNLSDAHTMHMVGHARVLQNGWDAMVENLDKCQPGRKCAPTAQHRFYPHSNKDVHIQMQQIRIWIT